MQLIVELDILIVLCYDSPEEICRKLRKSVVLVVLTNCKINKMPRYAIEVDLHESIEELQSVLIQIRFNKFLCQALRPLKVLNANFGSFFKDYQAIDVPSVESQATASVVH